MHIILFDHPEQRLSLLPFTYTRPVAAIRVGILTLAEKWPYYLPSDVSYLTEDYLQDKYPLLVTDDNLLVNGSICPDDALVATLLKLKQGESLVKGDFVIGIRADKTLAEEICGSKSFKTDNSQAFNGPLVLIDQLYEIFQQNASQIKADFKRVTSNRTSAGIPDKHTIVYAPENIFVEDGADIRAAVLNAESGPIYIGKNASVQEGAMIRGAFSLGKGSCLTMGARVRGDTTIGPHCKVGGEISNSVIFGHTNKAHEGFLGNAVVGEWCNLGADTNASNLKNNYGPVKLYSHKEQAMIDTGLQFCGLMMGDHSKCGINTMFNTGTVVGVNANVFGEGFPPVFVPSFSWGGSATLSTYQLEKSFEVASRVMERRNLLFNDVEKSIFKNIFDITQSQRTWDLK